MRFTAGYLALSALVFWARPLRAQDLRPELRDPDLKVAGFSLSADTAVVRRHLGAPQRIVVNKERDEEGQLLTDWHYRDLTVSFDEHGVCWMVLLLTPRYATSRGIRLGMSKAVTLRVYGAGEASDSVYVTYGRYTTNEDTRGITFGFSQGRVSSIQIGQVMSIE